MFYDTSLPEACEVPTKEHASSHHTTKPALKWSLIVVALVIAAAIAVGTGVGLWRHHEHSSQESSTTTRCGVRINLRFSLAHFYSPSAPPNPKVTSHPNVTRPAQYILNDTSLAAVSFPNGDRHLFFQNNAGLIQRVLRTASDNHWSMSANDDLSSSSNPKNYTPLAVDLFGDTQQVPVKN